jgi:DNA-directed RNA polymerase subunit RPC12/RpoP
MNEIVKNLDGNEIVDNKIESVIIPDYLNDEKLNLIVHDQISNDSKNERIIEIDENKVIELKKNNSSMHKKIDKNDENTKCPYCSTVVFIEDGCNFKTCSSVYCVGKKSFFCKICNKKLLYSEKVSHFPHGIFSDSCKNTNI